MSYITLPGKEAIRVSSVFLRYLAKGKETTENQCVISVLKIKGGISVQWDDMFHDFTYAELRKHSNYTDHTSTVYPFTGRVTRSQKDLFVRVVHYDDADGIIGGLRQNGFCFMNSLPSEENILRDFKQVVSSVRVTAAETDPANDTLHTSFASDKRSPDLRVIQGPFNLRIVNAMHVYSAIRTMERREREASLHSRDPNSETPLPRVVTESSCILEHAPIQDVHPAQDTPEVPITKVPILKNGKFRVSGVLPDPRIPNFHEYVGYYNNFVRTCYDMSIPACGDVSEGLIYDNNLCLTSSTSGARVIEVGPTDPQDDFVDFMGAGVGI